MTQPKEKKSSKSTKPRQVRLIVNDAGESCHPRCGQPYEPHTAKCVDCTVCIRFTALKRNASRERKYCEQAGMELSFEEWVEWFRVQDRRCTYCGVAESDIPRLGLVTSIGRPLQRLGVDRLNAGPYRLDNIALCCFKCNGVKSSNITAAEMMEHLGPAIAALWQERLTSSLAAA